MRHHGRARWALATFVVVFCTACPSAPATPRTARASGVATTAPESLAFVEGATETSTTAAPVTTPPTTPVTVAPTTTPPTTAAPTTLAPTTAPTTTTTAPPSSPATADSARPRAAFVFVPTGGDDTVALQQAIVDHPVVRIDAPVTANGRIHLQRLMDRTIEFGPAGVVRRTVLDRSWASLSVFNLTLAERVTVVNPRIEGSQPCNADGTMTHVQATNKQHAFDVRSSIDVTIIGGYARDLGGDGVYTSKLVSGAATPSGYYRDTTNLTLFGFSATCMGRNALSFTSDVNSHVTGGTFGPTGQYVIDVEPDANMSVTGLRISGVTVSGPSAWLACPGISPVVDTIVERPTITRSTTNACRRITPR